MFCPQEVVWGDVSSMVSAVGTVMAVSAALGIAWVDWRDRRAERRQIAADRLTNELHIMNQISGIFFDIADTCVRASRIISDHKEEGVGALKPIFDKLKAHAKMLYEAPGTTPYLMTMATEATLTIDQALTEDQQSPDWAQYTLEKARDFAANCHEALEEKIKEQEELLKSRSWPPVPRRSLP